MAGTLLHVTLADLLAAGSSLPKSASQAIRNHVHEYRLGSVLVDLPYYEDLWRHGLRSMLGLDIEYGIWGTLIHQRSPSGLSLALLDRADSPAGTALALGALTHYAVDVVFHEEIDRRVNEAADGSVSLDTIHKRIEDQMDLHIHYDMLGHSGIGTPYARQVLSLEPEPAWIDHTRGALIEIHGDAPSEAKLEAWLGNLVWFGWLSSFKHAPWLRTLPEDDPEMLEASLTLAEESLRLSEGYVRAGMQYLEAAIDREEFFKRIPDRSMLDAGPADPPRPASGKRQP
jgi:hypothetical protein